MTADEIMALADELHDWQTVNNQEYPESWHAGVDDCADYLRAAVEQIISAHHFEREKRNAAAVKLRERAERAEQDAARLRELLKLCRSALDPFAATDILDTIDRAVER